MMDVTSMLNASSKAAEQPKIVETSKIPTGNRTPWDAGGYSLPIHTLYNKPLTDHIRCNDSSMETIEPSRHKVSDSDSSLSSFASSHSTTHSRFSSISTVSSSYQPSHTATDGIFTDNEATSPSCKASTGSPSPISPFTALRPRPNSLSSLTGSVYGLALITESRFDEGIWDGPVDKTLPDAEMAKTRSTTRMEGRAVEPPANSIRPASPSDAILIKRTAPPIAPNPPGPSDLIVAEPFERPQPVSTPETALNVSEQQPGQVLVQSRGHKRAASAPHCPGAAGDFSQNGNRPSTSSSPTAELTLPSFRQKNSSSPEQSILYTSNIPPETSPPSQIRKPCCMYIADCDTGSQLRKAVSHIFGRNKMCTRRIPNHVWVWYCRKHYQRARYRNAKEWARTLQYDLVSRQIKRLQEWSEMNLRTGEGGVVKDYQLAIRKREQKRLEAQKGKREGDLSDSEDDEPSEPQGNTPSTTAVPKWLLNLSGRSHDAPKIMEIINGIQADLAEGTLSVWPDIEILPNIVIEQDEPEAPKGYVKGKPTAAAHRRSQSLGAGLRYDDHANGRRMSYSMAWPPSGFSLSGGLSQKRKRPDDRDEDEDNYVLRVAERPMAAERNTLSLAHQPVFQKIDEHQSHEENFGSARMHDDNYPFAASVYSGPLAAPTPLRCNALSTAAYLDSGLSTSEGTIPRPGRGMHKRSHSDMGALYNSQPSYRASARYGYRSPDSQYYNELAPRRSFSPPGLYYSSRAEISQQRPSHIRQQSTLMVTHSYRYQDSSPHSFHMLPSIQLPPASPGRYVIE